MWYWYWVNDLQHVKRIAHKLLWYNNSNKKFIFFDVWANIWQTIDGVLKERINNIEIYSFEPQETAFKILKNKVSENIKVFNLWFGDLIGDKIMYSESESDVSATIISSHMWSHEKTIKIDTIDNFCKVHGITYISYLKMDIEWSEYDALQWAKEMIWAWNIEAIEFEFLWQNIYARHFFKDFWDILSSQYTIYRILPRDIYEIKEYSHLLEIYCLSNFLCIKK